MGPLRSPRTGSVLTDDGDGLLRDSDGRLWPVFDEIPYLRAGRDNLVDQAVACLRAGDREEGLALLLADQDDWWTGARPEPAALQKLIRERQRLSLREAMALLAFDRVGTYFAHRWSDPTFLAGLALLEAHWRPALNAFELACGIGHYGREIARRGVDYTGGDVVFSKLWLARHWVLPPEASLVCFDAAAPWPIADELFDLVFCHDAFYFLEPKNVVLAGLRRLAGADGRVALSHIHNSGAENLSPGHAMSVVDLALFFPDAAIYDDAELTRALAEARAPRQETLDALQFVEAFAVEDRARAPAHALSGGLSVPLSKAVLQLNPLYRPDRDGLAVSWPSSRYEAEYGPRTTYPVRLSEQEVRMLQVSASNERAARRRILVDLPERW